MNDLRCDQPITLSPLHPDYAAVKEFLRLSAGRRKRAAETLELGEKAYRLRLNGAKWRLIGQALGYSTDNAAQRADNVARRYALSEGLELPNFRE